MEREVSKKRPKQLLSMEFIFLKVETDNKQTDNMSGATDPWRSILQGTGSLLWVRVGAAISSRGVREAQTLCISFGQRSEGSEGGSMQRAETGGLQTGARAGVRQGWKCVWKCPKYRWGANVATAK